MGGSDEPHVGLDCLFTADPLKPLFLKKAKDLGLGSERHVTDFVQKNRTTMTLLELANAPPLGASERPFFVTEEFALQQLFWDRCAVEGQEWGFGPRAVLVNGLGDQFLARSALTRNQDGERLVRNPANRLVNLLHCRARADDDFRGRVIVGASLGKERWRAHESGDLDRIAEHAVQFLQIEGL